MFNTQSSRFCPNRWSALLVLSILLYAPRAAADLRDPAAWRVLVPLADVFDLVPWQGQLVGALDGGGLLRFDPSTGALEHLETTDGLTSLRSLAVDVDAQGRLWVGTRNAGVYRLDASGSVRAITGLSDQIEVSVLAVDGETVYFGGPAGGGSIVSSLPEQTFTTESGMPSDEVQALDAHEGRAWFGTELGVGRFDRALNRVDVINDGLTDINVRAIHAGDRGVLAGGGGGLFQLDETDPENPVWQPTNPPIGVTVLDVARDGERIAALAFDNVVWSLEPGATQWELTSTSVDSTRSNAITFFGDEGTGQEVWVGGARREVGRIANEATALFWNLDQRRSAPVRGLIGQQARSIALDGQGGVWVGGFPVFDGVTHWRADQSVVAYNRRDSGGAASPANDGWIEGLKADMVVDDDGDLWVATTGAGITRLRPGGDVADAAQFLHLNSSNSPLQSARVRVMRIDSVGRIWMGSDGLNASGDFNVGVDVLVDPSSPLDPASWVKITPANSQIAGAALRSIEFEGSDVVWFALDGIGLQRWDFDSILESGNIEPSAFANPGSWREVNELPEGFGAEIDTPRWIERGDDGTFWLATDGEGLFSFRVDPDFGTTSDTERYFTLRPSTLWMSDQMRAVAVAPNGDAWAASDAGLQRVRVEGEAATAQSWTDLPAFLLRDLGSRFNPEILSPLAGSSLESLELDREANLLFIASRAGVSRLDLSAEGLDVGAELEVLLRPNPIRGEEQFYVDGFDGVADAVEIYALNGVLLHRTRNVRAGELVWDTRNVGNQRVVSGLYLVRVVQGDRVALQTLAVER